MADLDKLRKEYEAADAKAIKLSGAYQERIDKQVTAKWQELKEKYGPEIEEATQAAADAQQAYLDAEALEALKNRPDAERVLADLDRNVGSTTEGAERLRKLYKEQA